MHRHWLRTGLVAAVAVTVFAAAGCGDDDDEAEGSPSEDASTAEESQGSEEPADDDAAYCEAALAFATAPPPDIDFATATPAEMAAGLQAYGTDVMQPLVDDVIESAPEELADEAEVLQGAVDEMKSTGDFTAFETPEVSEADATAHAFDLENCGWQSVELATVDHAFEDFPDTVDAGVTSFDFTNEGEEVHELAVLRKSDGVTDTADELLAMDEAASADKVTLLGVGGPIAAGESQYLIVDLEPGDYIATSFVPVGMTSLDAPTEGAPQFTEGMVHEFTVE